MSFKFVQYFRLDRLGTQSCCAESYNSYTSKLLKIRLIMATVVTLGSILQAQQALALTTLQQKAMLRKYSAQAKKDKLKCKKYSSLRKSSKSSCDYDADGLPNIFEVKYLRTNMKKADTDGDSLSDKEKFIYGTDPRKKDTDGGGANDGQEVLVNHTNPLDGSDDQTNGGGSGGNGNNGNNNCGQLNFNSNGETSAFGIPSGTLGSTTQGLAIWSATCHLCHQAGTKDGKNFQQVAASFSQPMMAALSHTTQQIADITAYLNRNDLGGGPCPTATPTPSGTLTPTPIPSATPTPYIPATPCPGGNFDSQGNTTAFGIPTPLAGNITQGLTQYNTTCGSGGCHGNQNNGAQVRGLLWHFTQLKTAVTGPLMNLSPSDQQIANLVAYLNQTDVGGCSQPPPPTPTPNPVSQGMAIFMSSCTQGAGGCHSLNSQGLPREMGGTAPSKNKIHNALRTGPDAMPTFWQYTLGPSAPPYSSYENNLWAYFQSLPW